MGVHIGVMESKWAEIDQICYEFYELEENEINLIKGVGRVESRIPGGDTD